MVFPVNHHKIDASDTEEENILNDLMNQIENTERPNITLIIQKKKNLELGELWRQFIVHEREHYRVEHELKIQQSRELHEEKLLEIRGRCREREEIFKKQSRLWKVAIAAMENENFQQTSK